MFAIGFKVMVMLSSKIYQNWSTNVEVIRSQIWRVFQTVQLSDVKNASFLLQ